MERNPNMKTQTHPERTSQKYLKNNLTKPDSREQITVIRCNVIIKDQTIPAIIDTGATSSVMSNKLRKRLDIPIRETGNISFKMANGTNTAALGQIKVNVEMGNGIVISTIMQITDNPKELLLIGMETIVENEINIDLKRKRLTIEINNEVLEIPIYYTKIEDEEDESETESEYEEYEDMKELEMYTSYKELYYTETQEKEFKENLKTGEINEIQKKELNEILHEYQKMLKKK